VNRFIQDVSALGWNAELPQCSSCTEANQAFAAVYLMIASTDEVTVSLLEVKSGVDGALRLEGTGARPRLFLQSRHALSMSDKR
jgi:hypothetical protein